ncbi:T-cell receptor beta chain V region LB2 [Platysternon megacephalum]|nr:T-cell receptor beta chain V region LB2 [Platysternon megacephalum]
MEMQIVWCMAICLLGARGADVRFNQTLSLVLERGKVAELQCKQNINYDYMYWYQQLQGKGLHLIYYSYDIAKVEPGNISERFTAIRPQTQLFQLKISPVKPEDSAVYFCASSLDTVLQSHLLPLQKNLPFLNTTSERGTPSPTEEGGVLPHKGK